MKRLVNQGGHRDRRLLQVAEVTSSKMLSQGSLRFQPDGPTRSMFQPGPTWGGTNGQIVFDLLMNEELDL